MLYDIIKDFPGSQDGRFCEHFKAGTQAELSDYLAAIVVKEGWARPVAAPAPAAEPVQIEIEPVAENVKIGTLHLRRKGVSR